MKKLTLTIFALLALVLTGCKEPTKEQRDAEISSQIEEFSYKGHEYLLYEKHFGKMGVAGLAHDPDCPCHKKGGSEHGED